MAEYRIRSTGQVMLESELRQWARSNGGPSWEQTTDEVLEAIGADVVLEGPQATTTPPYEYSYRNGVEQIDGKWYTKYSVGPVFQDRPAEGDQPAQTAAEQMVAYKAQKDAEQSKNVRNQRTEKLADCDWTQLSDSPVDKEAWAAYRQALRDITTQAGFPWTVDWPVAP